MQIDITSTTETWCIKTNVICCLKPKQQHSNWGRELFNYSQCQRAKQITFIQSKFRPIWLRNVTFRDADNTNCSTNLSASGAVQEYDVITMTCSVTYSGNWAPVMRWFNSVARHNFIDDVTTSTTSDTATARVTSQLSVVASRGLNSSEIICVTYFTEPSPALPTSATNIPSFTYNWTSPTFNVIPRCK